MTLAMVVLAACTPSTPPTPAPTATPSPGWDERGPIVYARGRDTTGTVEHEIAEWNAEHPNEQVTLHELPASAEDQWTRIVENARAESGEFTVMAVDVAWLTEFAANGWLHQLPADQFPTTGILPLAVEAATHSGVLYAVPASLDVGVLLYRKDLLDEAGLTPPTTWADLEAVCDEILPDHGAMSCYAGQHSKDEDLTANVVEAVHSAGGEILTAAGVPAVTSPEAVAGLSWMAEGVESGMIPAGALTWDEADGLDAFVGGRLLFHRTWSRSWRAVDIADGRDVFGIAPLPGREGPGTSTLGGLALGVSPFARNLGTARDFIAWMTTPENQQRRLEVGALAPALEVAYGEPVASADAAFLTTVRATLSTAKLRPRVVTYQDVSLAIQEAADDALQGRKEPAAAMTELQATLEGLVTQRPG